MPEPNSGGGCAVVGVKCRLALRALLLGQLGATLGTRPEAQQIVAHVALGRLKPLLARAYPLEELAQAQMDFKAKNFFGKLVIVPR